MASIFLVLSVLRSSVACYQFDLQISSSYERATERLQSERLIYSASDFDPHAVALSAVNDEETASKCTEVCMRGNLHGEFALHDYVRSGKVCVISDHNEFIIPLLKREAKLGCPGLVTHAAKLKSSWVCENSILCNAGDLCEPLDRHIVEADLTNSRCTKILNSEHYLSCVGASKLILTPSYASGRGSYPASDQDLWDATGSYILNHLLEALYTLSYVTISLICLKYLLLMEFLTSRNMCKWILLTLLLIIPLSQAQGCSKNCLSCDSAKLCLVCEGDYKIMDGICLETCPYNSYADYETSQCSTPTGAVSRFTMNSLTGSVIESVSRQIVLTTGTDLSTFYPIADEADPYPSYLRGYYFQNSYLKGDIFEPLLSPYFLISITFRPKASDVPILVKTKPDGSDILYLYIESNIVKIKISVYDNVQKIETSLTHTCPVNGLVVDAWNRVTFQFSNNSFPNELICKIGNISSTNSFATRIYEFYDYSNGMLQIGAFGTSYYNGFIYEISTYYGVTENLVYGLEYTTNCNGCPNCPISLSPMCLSPCEYNADTNCNTCPESCSRGVCMSQTQCSLCFDFLCASCDNYKQGTCRSCLNNYNFVNRKCECGDGYYVDTSTGICDTCIFMCGTCTGPTIRDCITCSWFAHKYDGICYAYCPFGTTTSSGTCIPKSVTKSSLILNRITLGLTDSVGDTYLAGNNTDDFDHKIDSLDPIPAYHRGYYFKGGQYLTSEYTSDVLGHKFSISLLFKPESGGTIYARGDNSVNFFSIELTPQDILIKMRRLNSQIIQVSMRNLYTESNIITLFDEVAVPLNQWAHILISVDYDTTDTVMKLFYNNQLTASKLISGILYYEPYDPYIIIGAHVLDYAPTSFYSGYIYSICNDLPVSSSITSISQSFTSCNDCIFEIIGQGCLNDCPISSTPQSCDISCPTDCTTTGCVREQNCYLCQDPNCVACDYFDTTDCIQCNAGYYLDDSTHKCFKCNNVCQECSGPTAGNCITCSSSAVKYDGICYSSCPFGTAPSSGTCVQDTVTKSSLILNRITLGLTDSLGNIYFAGNNPNDFDHKIDSLDPIPAYQRGYYFKRGQYLKSQNPTTRFGHKFSISMIIKPEGKGTLYSREYNLIKYFSIELTFQRIQVTIMDLYTESNITVLFDEVLIDLNQWAHIVVSLDYAAGETVMKLFYNNELRNTSILSGSLHYEPNDPYIIIGAHIYDEVLSSFYSGYIYSICIELTVSNSYATVTQTFTSCNDCNFDIIGQGCLSNCPISSTPQNCDVSCPTDCSITGCVRDQSCNLCQDPKCLLCNYFDTNDCNECILNASGTPCECNSGYYWDESTQKCSKCNTLCQECSGPEFNECSVCSTGFYLHPNTCLSVCPTGYNADSENKICVLIRGQYANWNFNVIKNSVIDSISSLTADCGSTSNFYPNYDTNDPKAVFKRGYYFDGLDDIININPAQSAQLKISHAVALWFRPESLQESTILSKLDESRDTVWELKIVNFNLQLSIKLNTIINIDITEALRIGEWYHIVISCQHENSASTIKSYLNGSIFASTNYPLQNFVDNSAYFSIGCKPTLPNSTSCFNGYIFSMSLYNGHLDPNDVSPLISSSCSEGSCAICPAENGKCLSKCSRLEGVDELGNCIKCLDRCSDGCRDGTRCNLCKDYECSRCIDYEDTECQGCISNAALNGGDCMCLENKFVYKLEEEICKECQNGCVNCYGFEDWQCRECDSTKSLYLFLGSCLPYCPHGYVADDNIPRTCRETDNKLASFTFNKIQGIVQDTQGVFEFTTGTSSNFYPSYDANDPYAAYNRGYYFDGNSSYMKLTSNPILFAKSFTISLWLRPESSKLQTLLSKETSSSSPSFLLSLDNLFPRIDFIKTTGSTQETISHQFDHPLVLNTWNFIVFAINHQYSTSELVCYVNAEKSSTTGGSGFYLDSSDYHLYIGFNNTISDYFQGFIYNLNIFNSYLDSLEGLYTTSCDGLCSICPSGTCLSDCGFYEYEEGGVCASCPVECEFGCRNGNQCSLCEDNLCEACFDYVLNSCTKCYGLNGLDSNNRCACQTGYYLSQTDQNCKLCSSMCESCTDIGANYCILCSQGYFKTPENLCLQHCPIGYTANLDDRTCIQNKTPGLMISLKFDSFSANIADSVSGYDIVHGSSANFFPNYDDNDPIPVPNSGLYISSNKYATLAPKDEGLSLGNSFTMKLWVKAKTLDAEEVFLQKLKSASGEYSFSLSITSYGSYKAKFLLSSTVSDEAAYHTLETSNPAMRFLQASSSWDRVTTILHSDGSNTVAQLILNTNPATTLSIPNSYFKDTIDKVIQFGNRKPTSTFKGFIQNFKMYNIHMTHNQATSDFPSTCNCSACTEDGCISACEFNQLEVDGSCKDCLSSSKLGLLSSCRFGCIRTSDCHMNEDLLCETYTWYRASDCISCIPNAVKTDAGCKCIDNSTLNQLERKCECNHNYWLNGGRCELCVRWIQSNEVSAYFDENYRFVIYEFSQPVNLENVDCTSIFSSETISKFGTGYICKFENETKLSVYLGSGATLVDEKTVILDGKLKSMESGCNYNSSVLDITVSYIHPKPSPTALFDRIDNHYIECGDLTISGSRSEGTLGRSLNYKWTVETDPAIPALDKYSTSDFSTQDALSISNEDLEPASLTITLTVRNFLNMMDSITHTTKLVPGKGITVLFDPGVYYDIYRREYRTYSPRPVGQCEISDSLEYSWSYQGVSNSLTAFDVDLLMSSQKTTRMFVVPPNILPAGSIVTFRADITDTETGAEGYGEFDITIKLSKPIIVTDRAYGDIGVNQPLNVNAGNSFDPDELTSLEYEWSCSYSTTSCSEIISNPNSETLQIPPGTMEPDIQYEFTLEVLKSVSNSASLRRLQSKQLIDQKVLIFNTKNYPVPDANIIVENYDAAYTTSYSTVSELQLKLVLNDDENSYTIKWSKVQGGSIRFLTPDDGLYLVIAGGSMDPGILYTIEASLQDDEHTYGYYLDIYTNSPPLYGKLTSYPSKGEEFSTIFQLEARDWVDIDDNYPLQYGFGYVVLGEDKTLNAKNSTNIYYTQLPFCTDNLFVYAYDSLESYTRADLQIEVEYLESLSKEEILQIYVQKLNDPRTDILEMLGIANLLAIGGISREFYYTGIYPEKTQEEIEMIYDAFNLATEALRTLLSSSDYFSVQTLYGSVSVLNSLTDSPYLKNDTDSRQTVIDLLTYTIDLAYGNDVVEDRLIEMAVGTNDQIINFDSEDMYEYPGNMLDVVLAYDHILGSKAITMVPGQTLEGDSQNTKYRVIVLEVDRLNGFTLGLNNSIAEIMLPSNISEDVKRLYPDIDEVGMLIIDINIESKNASRADPSIVVFSMFDAMKEFPESLNVTLSDYFTMKIPLSNVPEVWDPTCGFLNETLKLWDARGCKLVSYNDEYGVCSCNHFTAFSLDEGLDQAGATFDNSNIDMTINVDAFNDIEWSGNAIGLYFCIGVIFIYTVAGIIVCRMDLKEDKQCQLERANSKPQTVETVQTPNIDNMMIFEEVKSDDEKKPSNKKLDVPSVERSTDRNPQMSQSDELFELKPEDIELLEKTEKQASLKNIKNSWWMRYKEKHSLLNLFLHYRPEMKRFARLTLVVVEFLGSMFFIGMFYDSDGKTKEAKEEKTFMETMKEYSWNDFWIMIYSTVIMAVAMIILAKLFTITPVTVDTAPDLEKKIMKKNKIKMILGYIIAFGLLGYFVWSIILFSIQFNIRASNMWIFSTSLTFVWENIVGQTYKLAIKTLIIVLILTLKAKRDQKKLEQGELKDDNGKKDNKERRKTRAETSSNIPAQLQSNDKIKSSSSKPHSNSSESKERSNGRFKERSRERSEGSAPEMLVDIPIVLPPDDYLPVSKKKKKSKRDKSSKSNR